MFRLGASMETIMLRKFAKPRSKDEKYYLNWNNCVNFINSKEWGRISKTKNSEIFFKLEGFDRVGLDGLMWLLLMGEILYKNNNYLILNLPKKESILRYIKSVGFHKIASDLFEIFPMFYLDEIKEYEEEKKGVKIKKVTNVNLQNIKRDFFWFIESGEFTKMRGTKHLLDEIFSEYTQSLLVTIISELLNNIIEHSGETINTGYGYTATFISGKKINIFIADVGIGFRKGLERKELVTKSDQEAIKKAFLFKYYKDTKVEGRGIFEVLKCLRKLGGWMLIRSGEAEGRLEMSEIRLYKEENEDEIIRKLVEDKLRIYKKGYFPGVQYSILIDTKRHYV